MSRDYIERKEIGDYRISIYPDYDTECPVTNWDMGACYLWEYTDRSQLSNSCNWKDWFSSNQHTLKEALRYMAACHVEQKDIVKYLKSGKVEDVRLVYNRHDHQWDYIIKPYRGEWDVWFSIQPSDLKHADYRSELVDYLDEDDLIALIENCAKNFVIKTWSSSGYSQGDYLEGVAYTTKERFDKYCGFNSKKYKTWQEQAIEIIDAEVEEIGMWAWGDVKGFVLEKKVSFTKVYDDDECEDEEDYEWKEIDSCWGYFMDTEELIQEVMSEHDIKEIA